MANIYDMADTWNAGATTFAAIKMNVTDTASAAASLLMDLQVGGTSKFRVFKNGKIKLNNTATIDYGVFQSNMFTFSTNDGSFSFAVGSGGPMSTIYIFGSYPGATRDAALERVAAGVIGVRASGSSVGGALEYIEQTAPSAPSADRVRVYAQDNGAGKTQLMALFSSGAAQQIAIQP